MGAGPLPEPSAPLWPAGPGPHMPWGACVQRCMFVTLWSRVRWCPRRTGGGAHGVRAVRRCWRRRASPQAPSSAWPALGVHTCRAPPGSAADKAAVVMLQVGVGGDTAAHPELGQALQLVRAAPGQADDHQGGEAAQRGQRAQVHAAARAKVQAAAASSTPRSASACLWGTAQRVPMTTRGFVPKGTPPPHLVTPVTTRGARLPSAAVRGCACQSPGRSCTRHTRLSCPPAAEAPVQDPGVEGLGRVWPPVSLRGGRCSALSWSCLLARAAAKVQGAAEPGTPG